VGSVPLYAEGYAPALPAVARFESRIVHPQNWCEDVAYANKRVIGSGATAITLVPQLAKSATHVAMLQRSPTYAVAWPDEDRIANALRDWLPVNTLEIEGSNKPALIAESLTLLTRPKGA
jgi:monooxygenase